MTGFRVAWGGAQVRYGVRPDLATFAKTIGGGLPVGAYVGPADFMDNVAPAGPVYQAGTLSGAPIGMAAGLAALRILREPGTYERLESSGTSVQKILEDAARAAGVPVRVQRVGSMFTMFFSDPSKPLRNLDDVKATRTDLFPVWHRTMLANGVSWPPSNFEAAFLTLAHGDAELERLDRAARKAFAAVRG
jgi:glutamate-1-semialdehyde 2,1-aminomutase